MWTLARIVAAAVVCGAALGAVNGCAGKARTQQQTATAPSGVAPADGAAATDGAEAAPKVWGAGSKKLASDQAAAAENARGQAAADAPIGPPARAPEVMESPKPAPVVQEAPLESISAAPAESPKKGKKAGPRADGRPEWWIDAPTAGDGRWTVAAEAMGDDVLSARRAAVDAGREALRRALGGAAGTATTDERIISTSVRPLPTKGVGAAGKRFVGYVLMSGGAG